MDWSNERYVRLYTRDTKTWKLIGWEGQVVWCLTLRKLDRAGVLDDVHNAEDLTVMIGAPLEVVEIGLARLLKYQVLIDSAKGLVSPNFIDAQEAAQSDKQRSKEARARKRDRALAPRPIDTDTNRDDTSDTIRDANVTSGHSASHGVTARHSVPSLAVPSLDPKAVEIRQDLSGSPRDELSLGDGSSSPSGLVPEPEVPVVHPTRRDAAAANVVGANGQSASRRRAPPGTLAQALEIPIRERAESIRIDPTMATYVEPHRWPEVEAVAAALAHATGMRRPRLGASRDRGVEAVVALYADGWTQAELERAVSVVARSEWWTKGSRGLASLTPEVVRRALGNEPELSPEEEAEVQANLARYGHAAS